ncbi:hypothetical protein [Sphingobium sp.]|uniref:hypothetical protein n=1 Tax=Sphingobium sp. TaxID=1912891 RepID=UPI0026353928|nr:hypothetical protein [Sphingobium sp.]
MPLPLLALAAAAQLACAMDDYRPQEGLIAENRTDGPTIEWKGDAGQTLRLRFALANGIPVIAALDIRRDAEEWTKVLRNAAPVYSIDTGLRRLSKQQMEPLRELGIPLTQDVVDRNRWDPFWDAPLDLSATSGRGRYQRMPPPDEGLPQAGQPGLPRNPAEIGHASAQFAVTGCTIRTDGARLIIRFPGVTLGSFAGRLQYSLFRGTNLIRQEVVVATEQPWVAYKFSAGLTGLGRNQPMRLRWRDTSGAWRSDTLSGPPTEQAVPVATANRILALEGGDAAISVFPEPHKFFWARETAINMRYSWYRRDADGHVAIGIRQNDREDESEDPANWALYSARPGTQQSMAMFLYPSIGTGEATIDAALRFTHGDRYKPLPGYQVMAHHYHMEMGRRYLAAGTPAEKLPDLIALKALGINIVSPVDSFVLHSFGSVIPPMAGPDPVRIMETAATAARLHSDHDFLIMPSQEWFGGPMGGHTDLITSHPLYWTERKPGEPLAQDDAPHGKLYHIGSADDLLAMMSAENGIISMPHPRTKGSAGYPDAIRDKPYFLNPRYDGMGMRWGMGLDGSERRLCDYRCWPLLDEMSNWLADKPEPLKHIMAISEVMAVRSGDDIYGSQPVTYVKLPTLPGPDDASSVIDALRAGDSFWTTGEVLLSGFGVSGEGASRVVTADLDWTFPLDFVELVWGDGHTIDRKIMSMTDLSANGAQHIEIPFRARNAKWVRIAAWDIAANGAVSQPIRIKR